jgi:hypothetical protein
MGLEAAFQGDPLVCRGGGDAVQRLAGHLLDRYARLLRQAADTAEFPAGLFVILDPQFENIVCVTIKGMSDRVDAVNDLVLFGHKKCSKFNVER